VLGFGEDLSLAFSTLLLPRGLYLISFKLLLSCNKDTVVQQAFSLSVCGCEVRLIDLCKITSTIKRNGVELVGCGD